jgi:hypothetical protein
VQPLVFDAGPFMERSGRPGIELLLEMGGKGGVKSAGNMPAGPSEIAPGYLAYGANLPRRSACSPRAGCWSHRMMK